jgi:hypothetical protein
MVDHVNMKNYELGVLFYPQPGTTLRTTQDQHPQSGIQGASGVSAAAELDRAGSGGSSAAHARPQESNGRATGTSGAREASSCSSSIGATATVWLPIPYDLPLTPYTEGDRMWVVDTLGGHSKPDAFGHRNVPTG